jgi:hypothetical protein
MNCKRHIRILKLGQLSMIIVVLFSLFHPSYAILMRVRRINQSVNHS